MSVTRSLLFILALSVALPATAEVTPKDGKKGAVSAPAPAKKKRRFFDTNELSKDRSLSGEKVPMTDDKPRKRKPLSEELSKDRSLPDQK